MLLLLGVLVVLVFGLVSVVRLRIVVYRFGGVLSLVWWVMGPASRRWEAGGLGGRRGGISGTGMRRGVGM